MRIQIKESIIKLIVSATLFIAVFIWFAKFNCYNLIYHEQSQLFLFSKNYFQSFLLKPGGISSYIGCFLVQFYQSPVFTAVTVTLTNLALFSLVFAILRRYRLNGILWSVIPVLLIALLQPHEKYLTGMTIGMIVSLLFFYMYISLRNDILRYVAGFTCCSLLYLICGSLAFLALTLCIIHETLYTRGRGWQIISLVYLILIIAIPYLASRTIYYIKGNEIWFALFPLQIKKSFYPFVAATILYLPVILMLLKFRQVYIKNNLFPDGTGNPWWPRYRLLLSWRFY